MPDDVVAPEMRAVLDALGAHAELQEWWRTEQPNVTVVVLRDDNAIQLITLPAWMPSESPHSLNDNLYPRPLPPVASVGAYVVNGGGVIEWATSNVVSIDFEEMQTRVDDDDDSLDVLEYVRDQRAKIEDYPGLFPEATARDVDELVRSAEAHVYRRVLKLWDSWEGEADTEREIIACGEALGVEVREGEDFITTIVTAVRKANEN